MTSRHPTPFLARCTLWTGALLTAFAVHAGPAEDVKAADTALRAGDLLRAAEFETEAVVLYRKAADKGEPAGEVGLGRAYADGAGVKQDAAAALELYRKAEQKNYGPAHDALARAYRTGTLGLAKDLDKAKAYEAKSQAWQKTQTAEAR